MVPRSALEALSNYIGNMHYRIFLEGRKSTWSNCRSINGVGIVDYKSERGLIPMVALEDWQPYFAMIAREIAAADPESNMRVVVEGRPNAVIHMKSSLMETLESMPHWTNKKRQISKAQFNLQNTSEFEPSELYQHWKSTLIHLTKKYDEVAIKTHLEPHHYAIDDDWYPRFKVVAVRERVTGDMLGAGYFCVSPDGKEWFWSGSVMNYEDPRTKEYSLGNCIIMEGMHQALMNGAERMNLGLDLYEYKARNWGTVRQWDTGLEYINHEGLET